MSRVRVKICGITRADAAQAAAGCGVDAVGFVFFEPSPRNLSPAHAAELAALLPRSVQRVAVFLKPRQELVDEVRRCLEPDWIQSEATDFRWLDIGESCRPLPVFRDDQTEDMPSTVPERLLFEGARSGTGERSDWGVAARWARRTDLILAGGLDAGNVGAAIRRVRPYGVDVSSGVEREPGVKDPQRIRAFVAAVRAAGIDNLETEQ